MKSTKVSKQQEISSKQCVRSSTRLNDVTSQKITLFIATAVRTLDSAVVITCLISRSISDAAGKEAFI
jgi:hypothetical protein